MCDFAVGIDDLVKGGCKGCTVAKGVKELYLLAKKGTNDFKVAKKAVKSTGLKFSVVRFFSRRERTRREGLV